MKAFGNAPLIAFYTIASKEMHRFLRIWIQTLIPPVITTTLYFIIFGHFLGKNIPNIHGKSYITFIVPGLIMMAVIMAAYVNVVSSFFSARFQRHIEEIMVSPTSNFVLLCGYLSGGVLRGLCVGIIVAIISIFFTNLHIQHIWLMCFILIVTALLFSLGGFINGLFARKFDDIGLVPTFILTPLTYLGGVFYSINLLPSFWKDVSMFNPELYIINAFRYSCLGFADINIDYSIVVMVSVTIALFGLSLILLNKGVGLRQ